jgi:hypothetical protein
MSKIYVDEIAPKTAGGNIANNINCLAQVSLGTGNPDDTSNPYSPSSGTVIKFDLVQINRGNVYSPSTGVFTAPVDGVYEVGFSLLCGASTNTDHNYQIHLNGTRVTNASDVYCQVDILHIPLSTRRYIELSANDEITIVFISGEISINADGQYNSAYFRYIGA